MGEDARAEWLRAGRVGRPHGLDGSFHVTAPVPMLLQEGAEVTVGETARRIERRAGHERGVILRLEGCGDRASADALRGSDLLVRRLEAPVLDEDEWWAEELEGCQVTDAGQAVGVVRRLLALPSCEVLEVERADGRGELLVPLVSEAVRSVDVEGRVVDVDLGFLGEG